MCYMLGVSFSAVEENNAFMPRLTYIRQRLIPYARPTVYNLKLMTTRFDKVEREATHTHTHPLRGTKAVQTCDKKA